MNWATPAARLQGSQRHEQQIGKGDAGERYREIEFPGLIGEAGRYHIHQYRHGNLGHGGEQQQPGEHHRKNVFGEASRLALAATLQLLGEHRHESRIEGAFGEERAEQVREAEGHDESLRHRTRAEHGSGEHVADEACHPAHHGEPAHGRGRFEESHGIGFYFAGWILTRLYSEANPYRQSLQLWRDAL
jgi:hypothetical protein